MKQTIIIGSGPAGISAALYTARAGIPTTVLSKGIGALEKAEKIENYFGFSSPVPGTELYRAGIAGAERLGVAFVQTEVVSIEYGDPYTVKTTAGDYDAGAVILATGAARNVPKVSGIRELEGKGISYCATCDAFFYRGKDVAVLGYGEYALHEANELSHVVKSVTLLTNGKEPTFDPPGALRVIKNKIAAVKGRERLEQIVFEDADAYACDGLFIAYGVAGSAELARKLGAITEGNKIIVNAEMATNLPGVFAAGDCTGGLMQIAKAVYEGAVAAGSAIRHIRSL